MIILIISHDEVDIMKNYYLAGAVIGTVLPYYFLIQFLNQNGGNLSLIINQLFGNPISTFFVMDVLVSALVLLIFIFSEGVELEAWKKLVCISGVLLVGVSLGLPLFLYFRDQ
jgi:hypothetical protein